MKMMRRIIGLTALLAMLAFPASTFASGYSSYNNDQNKGFFSSIFSFFGGSPGDKYSGYDYDYNKDYGKDKNKNKDKDKTKDKNEFWGWVKNNDWWEDYCWWDDNKTDSWKIWEKYYCW